ncbi:MAG: transcriptional regulator [Gammaproteobacteria bacterium SG8_30]|jgi:nitrogen regulatory protein PII|nr:MAG: transcriptional regulator [Gammaproteobacteria bacterium SG8_30]
MHFKLIVVMVEDQKTEAVLEAAREAGATGATVLNQARGEGLKPAKTFFGLSIESQRDVILLLVEEHMSRRILETIARVGHFDDTPGTGIALQVDVEDAVGVRHQIKALTESVEEEL